MRRQGLVAVVITAALSLSLAAPADALVEAKKKPRPKPKPAAGIIVPGRYECAMVNPYSATFATFKGNSYTHAYSDGSPIGSGSYRPAPDAAPQFGGTTVWFVGGGFDGYVGEFVKAGTTDPGTGKAYPTNTIQISVRPGGYAAVSCIPK